MSDEFIKRLAKIRDTLLAGELPTEQEVLDLYPLVKDESGMAIKEGVINHGVMLDGKLHSWKEIRDILAILDNEAKKRFAGYERDNTFWTALQLVHLLEDPDSKLGRFHFGRQ